MDNITNGDILVSPESLEWLPGLQTGACIFYSIILIVGVIGNILVIIIVSKYRDMRNATNLLLTNLSVADLLLLLFCVPDGYQHLYGKDKHRLGAFMCSFSPFIQNTTSLCSVLTIMAISYERYVAICQPLKNSQLHLTLFRTLPAVIIFWVISCIVSIPFFQYSIIELANSSYNETITTCFTTFPESWANKYLIGFTLCPYLTIFVLLCYWHVSICCILFNREALLRDNTVVTRYRRQVSQLLIVLIISFFILILPHKIWAIIHQRLNYEELIELGFHSHSLIIIMTRTLIYLNSAINPLLYSILSTKFRQSFVLLCRGCRPLPKRRRGGDAISYKEYTLRHGTFANRTTGGGTISTMAKGSTYLPSGNQFHEKKSLVSENTPGQIIGMPLQERHFKFDGSIQFI